MLGKVTRVPGKIEKDVYECQERRRKEKYEQQEEEEACICARARRKACKRANEGVRKWRGCKVAGQEACVAKA